MLRIPLVDVFSIGLPDAWHPNGKSLCWINGTGLFRQSPHALQLMPFSNIIAFETSGGFQLAITDDGLFWGPDDRPLTQIEVPEGWLRASAVCSLIFKRHRYYIYDHNTGDFHKLPMGAKDPQPLPDAVGACWKDGRELYCWTVDRKCRFIDTTDSKCSNPMPLPNGWVCCRSDGALLFHHPKQQERRVETPDDMSVHPFEPKALLLYDEDAVLLNIETGDSTKIQLTIGIEELIGFADRPLFYTEDGAIRDDQENIIWSGCLPGIVGRNNDRICGPGGALWDNDGNKIEEIPTVEWMLTGPNGFYLFTDSEILYLSNNGGLKHYSDLPFPILNIEMEEGYFILHGEDEIEMEMPLPEAKVHFVENKTLLEDVFVCSDAWSDNGAHYIIDEDGSFFRIDRIVDANNTH